MTAPARRTAWLIRLGSWTLRLLASTWRIQAVNDAVGRGRTGGEPVIFALWHGEMLPLLWVRRREGIVVMISEHGDGELIAGIARTLGYGTVRGSTTRGAMRALLGASRALERGCDIAITPDGPRGPAERFTAGALVVAQRSDAPLVAIRCTADRGWRLKSWDHFLVPKPFARVRVACSEPTRVAASTLRDAAAEESRFQRIMAEVGDRAARAE